MTDYSKVSLRIAPEFIEPASIKNLTDEEALKLLEHIRSKRLIIVLQYNQLLESKNKAKEQKVMQKIDKVLAKVERNLTKLDAILETIETDLNNARNLRMEVEEFNA